VEHTKPVVYLRVKTVYVSFRTTFLLGLFTQCMKKITIPCTKPHPQTKRKRHTRIFQLYAVSMPIQTIVMSQCHVINGVYIISKLHLSFRITYYRHQYLVAQASISNVSMQSVSNFIYKCKRGLHLIWNARWVVKIRVAATACNGRRSNFILPVSTVYTVGIFIRRVFLGICSPVVSGAPYWLHTTNCRALLTNEGRLYFGRQCPF